MVAGQPSGVAMLELDESIGFSGQVRRGLHAHPGKPGRMLFVGGGCIIMSDEDGKSQQTFLRGHDDNISCVAISPATGRLAASGQCGKNADVLLWDTQERRILFRLSEHDNGISCLAFSPDERLLVTVGNVVDKKVFVWDTMTGHIVATAVLAVRGQPAPLVTNVTFSPVSVASAGTYHFATSSAKGVSHWTLDPRMGQLGCEPLHTASVHRAFSSVAFSPDAAHLHAGTESGDIVTWVLRTGVMTDITPVACTKGVLVLTTLGDGRLLVGGGDGTVSVVTPGYAAPPPMGPTSVQPTTEALLGVAAGGRESVHKSNTVLPSQRGYKQPPANTGVAELMAAGGGGALGKAANGSNAVLGEVTSASVTADGTGCLVGTSYGYMYYVGFGDLRPVLQREGHRGAITGLAFSPDRADRVVSCSADGTVRTWDLRTFSQASVGLISTKEGAAAVQTAATCVAVQADVAISGWSDGYLRCHGLDTGKLMWEMPNAHPQKATAIAAAAAAPFAVTGGEGGEVRIWDTLSLKMVTNHKEHAAAVTDVFISADGSRALSCSKDRSLFSWDVGRKCRTSVHTQRLGHMNALAVAPDGLTVATVGQDKRIVLWDLRAPQAVSALEDAHGAEGTCAAISPSGQLLATGGADAVVRVWDLAAGSLVAEGIQHAAPLTAVKWSPDGARIVSAGLDGMIYVFHSP